MNTFTFCYRSLCIKHARVINLKILASIIHVCMHVIVNSAREIKYKYISKSY